MSGARHGKHQIGLPCIAFAHPCVADRDAGVVVQDAHLQATGRRLDLAVAGAGQVDREIFVVFSQSFGCYVHGHRLGKDAAGKGLGARRQCATSEITGRCLVATASHDAPLHRGSPGIVVVARWAGDGEGVRNGAAVDFGLFQRRCGCRNRPCGVVVHDGYRKVHGALVRAVSSL